MGTKVFGIQEEDFFKFIRRINDFNEENKVIATQTHIHENNFYAIIYFESHKQGDKLLKKTSPFLTSPLATPEQISFLKKNNIKFKEPISKKEAWIIIKKIKEGK